MLKLFYNQRGLDAKQNVREWLCRKDADHRDKLLACGAIIVAELRMQVLKETEFSCSAGIAHNKVGNKFILSYPVFFTDFSLHKDTLLK